MFPKTQYSLVERLQRGDEYPAYQDECARLVEFYKGLMVAAALRVGLRHPDCEDVFQITMVEILSHSLKRYDREKGSFHGWLYSFAQRRAIDWLRKQDKEIPTDPASTEFQQRKAKGIDPAGALDIQARLALADSALTWLVQRKRVNSNTAAIYRALMFEEGEFEDVAKNFNTTANVVYNIKLRVQPNHRAVYEALCEGMDPEAALHK